jgi:hypothetical protein
MATTATQEWVAGGDTTALTVSSATNAEFAVINSTSTIDGYIAFLTGTINFQNRVNQGSVATTGLLYDGTVYNYTLTNSTWHAVTGVYNSTSGFANVDGTQQTIASTGAGTGNGDIFVGHGLSAGFTMSMSELLFWVGAAPTNAEIIGGCHNASLYWGGITGSGGC